MSEAFWQGRRVLVTGHTGFKGAWLALWLARLGAEVTAFARPADQRPALWDAFAGRLPVASHLGDLNDPAALASAVAASRPQVVLHLAAQALVRAGYRDPAGTFASNVMGTLSLLEALRGQPDLRAVLVVTSDKVYRNDETGRAFREGDPLGGSDPYSASKAAAEIVVASYREAFFRPAGVPLATARGGNVIGGGDWSADRLVPDAVRARQAGQPLELRNPAAWRPWQHVLDCLAGYLAYAEGLAEGRELPPALNFGPDDGARLTVAEVAERIGAALGAAPPWRHQPAPEAPEKQALALDPALALASLPWHPRLSTAEAVAWTAAWYRAWAAGAAPLALCDAELARYRAL
jgi:CDP-glucose 4,6-dehydratase